jgi:hypothetical protein
MATAANVLLHRLIKLYPVRVIREQFDVTGVAQDPMITDIIASNARATLIRFCYDSFNTTKQHVHLYKLGRNFRIRNFDKEDFVWDVVEHTKSSEELVLFCLPKVKYRVTLANPFRAEDLDFYQPVKITFRGDLVIVQFIILEKNVESYYQKGDFIKSDRETKEEDLIEEFIDYLDDDYNVETNDINTGVKHLWDTDLLDSKYVKFKKAKSTSTEAMDEGETVKVSLPEEYETLMSAPLQKTVFKYLGEDDEFCSAFTADPTKGQLSFTRYPDNENQIQNVIDEILSNN